MTITDTITGDVLQYESIDEFQERGKQAFDTAAHEIVDRMCDALRNDEPTEEYESALGIKVR